MNGIELTLETRLLLGFGRMTIIEVRILTSFGAGDLGTEVDFLYSFDVGHQGNILDHMMYIISLIF